MTARHDNVLLVTALGDGDNVAGVPVLVDGMDRDCADDGGIGEGGKDGCTIGTADGAGGDVGSDLTDGLAECSATNLAVHIVIENGAGSTCGTSQRDLQAKLAGSTLDQRNLASNARVVFLSLWSESCTIQCDVSSGITKTQPRSAAATTGALTEPLGP